MVGTWVMLISLTFASIIDSSASQSTCPYASSGTTRTVQPVHWATCRQAMKLEAYSAVAVRITSPRPSVRANP